MTPFRNAIPSACNAGEENNRKLRPLTLSSNKVRTGALVRMMMERVEPGHKAFSAKTDFQHRADRDFSV
jgi:hypothetical protein